jgi:hypothetical protein
MGKNLADKLGGPIGIRVVEKLIGFAGFDDLAFVHEDEPVGHLKAGTDKNRPCPPDRPGTAFSGSILRLCPFLTCAATSNKILSDNLLNR